MPVKHKIIGNSYLLKMDLSNQLAITNNLTNKCCICREDIVEGEETVEHIYPKWFLKKTNLWNESIVLPNGTRIKYRQLTVKCCKNCNNEAMSENEKNIMNAFEEGHKSILELDENLLVWWLLKIYYLKILKETTMLNDRTKQDKGMIINSSDIKYFDAIYSYLIFLLQGLTFKDSIPFEVYIYQIKEDVSFDYADDIQSNTVLLVYNKTVIICSFNSFSLFKETYQQELNTLNSKKLISLIEAYELFARIAFIKKHYTFDTSISLGASKKDKLFVKHDILNFKTINDPKKNLRAFHLSLEFYLKRLNPDIHFPDFIDNGKTITFISPHSE